MDKLEQMLRNPHFIEDVVDGVLRKVPDYYRQKEEIKAWIKSEGYVKLEDVKIDRVKFDAILNMYMQTLGIRLKHKDFNRIYSEFVESEILRIKGEGGE